MILEFTGVDTSKATVDGMARREGDASNLPLLSICIPSVKVRRCWMIWEQVGKRRCLGERLSELGEILLSLMRWTRLIYIIY